MSYLFVAHENILSVLDTHEQRWIEHIPFGVEKDQEDLLSKKTRHLTDATHFNKIKDKQIVRLFRINLGKEAHKASIGILFNDGAIKMLELKQKILKK